VHPFRTERSNPDPKKTNKTKATDGVHSSLGSPSSHQQGFLPANGGWDNLLSFPKARIVYDGTVCFCDRFLNKHSRAYDQMAQAARSGKQNILERVEEIQIIGTSRRTARRGRT
jgi:hypothetical protein